jgi:hypothetical protein
VVLKNDVFTLVGDHELYHKNEQDYIDSLHLVNATKERCAKEQIAKKDIFDQETAKYKLFKNHNNISVNEKFIVIVIQMQMWLTIQFPEAFRE